jgi:predicted MarR family transcription regulator
VSELVDLGLVRREADPKDGRATLLTITSAGRDACDDLRRRRRFLLAELLAEWPDERIDALTDLLRSFSSAVEVRAKDDGALRRTLREVPSVTNGAGDGASLSSALSSEETA